VPSLLLCAVAGLQALGAIPAGGSPAARLLRGVGARAEKRVADATVSARLAATRVGAECPFTKECL
jgi:hypothetical protein